MSEAEASWGNPNSLPSEKPASGIVFHYTSAEVGIFNILGSGTLRLSPMNTMNDPWESEPFQPNFSVPEDENMHTFLTEVGNDAWAEIDRDIRLHTKMVSLTRDWGERSFLEAGPGPGWGHLSSWAHYGARQTGICLGFNLDALLEQFHKVGGDDALRVHGPVRYWEFEHEQYLESVQSHYPRTYGTDAIARHYAEQYGDLIFLSKNSDWSSEYEYRLALMNKSTLPAYIDIRPALAGVVVGSRFSEGLRAALFEALADYKGIEAAQIYQRNRHSMVIPYRAREGYGGSKFVPASSGGLLERVALLRDEETLSGRNRTRPA